MKQEIYEKIEAYQGLLEELKLQLIELTVAKDLASQMKVRLKLLLADTTRKRRRLYYRNHLSFLVEGIAVLERGIISATNNIEHYESKFNKYLVEVQP